MRVRVVRLGDSVSAWSVIVTVRMIVVLMTMRGPVIERIVHEGQQRAGDQEAKGATRAKDAGGATHNENLFSKAS
jgi:hypothetical protein